MTRALMLLFAIVLSMWARQAAAVDAVASIKPVHSLAAAIMDGVAVPHLIVKGGGSPHGYALKPSDARALEKARVVFWIGPANERFLSHALETLAGGAKIVELGGLEGMTRFSLREGGLWAGHGHDEHDHHGHGPMDGHMWLDPMNAKIMAQAIARALVAADPGNAGAYRANEKSVLARVDALDAALAGHLAAVADRPFVVSHDAFQYFEKRYGLNALGALTVTPDLKPGARRIRALRARLRETNAACVFTEPGFKPRLIASIVEGTGAGTGSLDPLGAGIPAGPELYFRMMEGNAATFVNCLSGR